MPSIQGAEKNSGKFEAPLACPVCGRATMRRTATWRSLCTECNFEFSWLEPRIDESHFGTAIDETARRKALDGLRSANAARILGAIGRIRPLQGAGLLDVGCAYGWFLDAARSHGSVTTGIEPERPIAEDAQASGHSVRIGFFPAALGETERFDVICFNDVLEHIPDPASVAHACHRHLNAGGLLSVVLPLRTGVFYRVALVLEKCGIAGPMGRMWQISFHSPHVSYFSERSMDGLLSGAGFDRVLVRSLPSVTWRGLWSRLRYDRRASWLVSACQWLMLSVAIPFIALFPADIGHFVYRRKG